ncbi:YncE family protein [Edaphobacter modestus]|uniref:YVTN family beta-propeller protein n=1 Tax=Edaphobacter modestus TaxID=388466 RepID=A0A4Q7YSX1_9BACT|nr:YncE family protein [Edaphobacter modestus]RZU40121.1 YVTN family beta-propeller protein [Edaphobacter modestus]
MRLRKGMIGLALLCASVATAAAQHYHVSEHWRVGGQGGWDYLLSDDAAHRLYIAHNARVEVIDTTTGKVLGAVTGFKSTHGIALDPNGRVGYISDGAGNAIGIFDRKTLSVLKTVPAGTNPDGIAFEPTTKTVWAFNGKSSNVTVLDTASNQVIATIPLPGKPEFPQVDGHGSVFVNIEDKNVIVKLNAASQKMVATWSLKGCEAPSGMAIDHAKHRLFSVCDGNKMAIVDYGTGELLSLATIGDSPDAAAFDAKRGLAFSSNGGDGTLSVIDTTKPTFPTATSLPTAKGAKTMAFDATTGRIFIGAAEYEPAPASSHAVPHPRAAVVPDSFQVIVVQP